LNTKVKSKKVIFIPYEQLQVSTSTKNYFSMTSMTPNGELLFYCPDSMSVHKAVTNTMSDRDWQFLWITENRSNEGYLEVPKRMVTTTLKAKYPTEDGLALQPGRDVPLNCFLDTKSVRVSGRAHSVVNFKLTTPPKSNSVRCENYHGVRWLYVITDHHTELFRIHKMLNYDAVISMVNKALFVHRIPQSDATPLFEAIITEIDIMYNR